jgi:phage/plasmid-associated DNA primase
MAQHVYATNTLPPFTGGMDRGVQRRLLPVNFEKPVAEEDRVPEIGSRILDGESDLVLAWAVAGASRLIRQGGFTQCAVCHETLQAWMRDSDPVKAWAAARVRLGEIPAVFKQNGYRKREVYAHFTEWAEEYGYRKDRIPSPPQFWERLGQDFPVVLKRKVDSRAIRGITILLGDDGDLDGVDAPANDNCPISEKINNLTSAYNNVAAAGLHKKPGTNAYVDETGCEVWGEELDMAVRQGKRVAKH